MAIAMTAEDLARRLAAGGRTAAGAFDSSSGKRTRWCGKDGYGGGRGDRRPMKTPRSTFFTLTYDTGGPARRAVRRIAPCPRQRRGRFFE